jgi:cytochrome c-type biogenesis protein CcmH
MNARRFLHTLALAAFCVGAALAPNAALAMGANEALSDPAREARARALFKQLRCLVCQNQSIDDSDADLARDLRIIVRERIQAGESDRQVLAFLTARYGDFVLLKPPVKTATLALWLTPFALLLVGAGGIVIAIRRRRGTPAAESAPALSADEKTRLAALLERDNTGTGQ